MGLSRTDSIADVLVVDDNPPTADSLAAFLEHNGFRVQVAYGTTDALAKLVGWIPDAAILDVDGGLSLAERLYNFDKPPLLIGLLPPGTAQRISPSELSVFQFLFSKTVSPAQLSQVIYEYISHRTRRIE